MRVLTIAQPRRQTVDLSVFVRTGSQHERPRENGISHVVEHMAFKGTATRSCQQINLDAELLGAEVSAHTDKDHTAFHMSGLARDAPRFVRMLAEIVQHGSFPEAELERERQVILHELTEDDEDPVTAAFKLFDQACWGHHPYAQPVIGHRAAIARITRADLQAYVQRQYTACNVVVAVAGGIEPDRIAAEAAAAFAEMPRGQANLVPPPPFRGGLKKRRLSGSAQTHSVIGFPLPSLAGEPHAGIVAAALFGEGMSSPLLDQIRERQGLAYHLACSADITELAGQFVVEATTAPEQAGAYFAEVRRLLAEQAARIDPVALARARNQLAVRSLRQGEQAGRRLEAAALDLFARGAVRSQAESLARLQAVSAEQVRALITGMLAGPAAIAIAGKVPAGLAERAGALFGLGPG
ncbi:MAG: insulinase family protein [Burkholderiales bacterium]|nr:insulinase family protein [Burkholderiales bacterium]